MSVQTGDVIYVEAHKGEDKNYLARVGEIRRVQKNRKNNAPVEGGTLVKLQKLHDNTWRSYYLEQTQYRHPSVWQAIYHNVLATIGLRKGKI